MLMMINKKEEEESKEDEEGFVFVKTKSNLYLLNRDVFPQRYDN